MPPSKEALKISHPPLPKAIQVEVTTRCNLNCIMCNTEGRLRTGRDMTLAEFENIYSRFPALDRVTLHGIGEPLLNPDFLLIAAYVKAKGSQVFLNTNLSLADRQISEKLLSMEVDEIRVSLDSAVPEIYREIRREDLFEHVLANLKNLLSLRDSLSSKSKIKIVAVAMAENTLQLPSLANLALELGVDELMVQNMQFWSGNQDYFARRSQHKADALFEQVYQQCCKITAGKIVFKMPHRGTHHQCNWPWTSLFVSVEGEVTACCNCPDPRVLSFGNLQHQTLEEIWWSSNYQKFRSSLADQMDIPEICRSCVIGEGRFKEY